MSERVAEPPRPLIGVTAGGLRARVGAHLRIPMFRDGYALVLSGLITAGVGVVYWVVAARRYSPVDVGLNSAAISAMSLVAGIAQLNLASALIRFVPVAGRTTFRLILFSYLTSVGAAGVLSAAFLLGGRRLLPSLELVDETAALALLFVGATMTWCVFVLQDAVLTGLRRAVWVPVENGVFSLVKLALLVGFASAFPRHGIFSSWALGAIATLVPLTALIFARLVPRHVALSTGHEAPPAPRELAAFVAPDYLGALGWLAAVTVVPLVVTERLGPTANAYYALAWVIAIPIFFVSASMGSSLVVSGVVADPGLLPGYLRRMLVQTTLLVLPMVAIVEVSAPYLLRIFGDAYSEHGTTVLRLLALSAVPHVPIALAINAARVRRRMRVVVAVQAAEAAGILALTWFLLGPYGVDGAGWAWLIAQTAVAGAAGAWMVAESGAPAAIGRRRTTLAGGRRRRTLLPVLEDILGRVEATVDADARLGCGRLLGAAASDAIVVAAGTRDEPRLVAVKLAHTASGATSLRREIEVLETLSGDARLGGFRRLLPPVVTAGEADGYVFLVQRFAAGLDGRRLVRDPELRAALLARAGAAIGELHRVTAAPRVVDASLLERWVDGPLASFTGAEQSLVERVRAMLYDGLAGRTLPLGWTHGDFVPGNVLAAGDGSSVTGIVDWDQATPDGLPLLDAVQFALATRLLAGGGELGTLVASLVHSPRFDEGESALFSGAREGLPGDEVDLGTAVLLSWLRHVSSNLEKSARYRSSRFWFRANVAHVLERVAR